MHNFKKSNFKPYIPFDFFKKDNVHKDAILLLESGEVFFGYSFGSEDLGIGELCFNTSITGYQEIITDPSYSKQIINFTFPHIGNVGTNKSDYEGKSHVSGIITRQVPTENSNWRSEKHFSKWLKELSIPGIAGIDTRKLTKIIRSRKTINAVISKFDNKKQINELNEVLKNYPSMEGLELLSDISTKKEYFWNEHLHNLLKNKNKKNDKKLTVISLDYGVKSNILRNLTHRNMEVTVLPFDTNLQEIISRNPDGIFLSNGPGDPEASDKCVFKLLKNLIQTKVPIFGICIGHQLIALSLGAKTSKMKQGHRGGNHPVKNLETNNVEITSQNHGFVVDINSLPNELEVSHISLFDKSIEGIKHKKLPIFSVQFHPEASPGPTDTTYLFDKFYKLCLKYHNAKKK